MPLRLFRICVLLFCDKNFQNSSPNPNDNDSTEQTLIEETYIEVLLPGVSQLNTSALESLLNSTANNTLSTSSTTSRIDTPSSTQGRAVRDTSSEDNDDSSGEESKKPSDFDSSSDENSSEEKANTSFVCNS